MMIPSRMELASIHRSSFQTCNWDDIMFWTEQINMFPGDFITVELPERGEYVTYELDGGKVIRVIVTAGWPNLSGCPDLW